MPLDDLQHTARVLERRVFQHRRPHQRRYERCESFPRLDFKLCSRRRSSLLPGILPGRAVVLIDNTVERPFGNAALGRRKAGKNSVEIFGVLEVLVDDGRGIRVARDKFLEERVRVPLLAVENVFDDAAQKGDVRACAHRSVNIGDGAGAGEARIDVDDLGAVLHLGLHRPAEGDGMVLRHVGAHDHDAVGVDHAAGVEGGRAAAEACPQTGDARAVSYPRLVLDRHDAEAAHELLVHVIELGFERGAAEGEDGGRHIDDLAVGQLLDEGLVARLLHQLGDAGHRALQVPYFPVGGASGPMENLRWTIGIDVELENRSALGTESAFIVRTPGIALDVDDLPIDRVNEGSAAHRAIGAKARGNLRVLDPEFLRPGDRWAEIHSRSDQSSERRATRCRNRQLEKTTSRNGHKYLRISTSRERKSCGLADWPTYPPSRLWCQVVFFRVCCSKVNLSEVPKETWVKTCAKPQSFGLLTSAMFHYILSFTNW